MSQIALFRQKCDYTNIKFVARILLCNADSKMMMGVILEMLASQWQLCILENTADLYSIHPYV